MYANLHFATIFPPRHALPQDIEYEVPLSKEFSSKRNYTIVLKSMPFKQQFALSVNTIL